MAGCTDVQTVSTASGAAVNGDAEAANTQYESHLMREPELDALLHKYRDRFSATLPESLPPERNTGHTIPLDLALSLHSSMHIG